MRLPQGKVITARGPVEPAALGKVLMHEHLYCDFFDWDKKELNTEEKPVSPERRELLMKDAIPNLKKCTEHGCFAFVDPTFAPCRAWPTFYPEASAAAGIHIILCTGFYREMELNTYFVKKPEDAIWPFVKKASIEELEEFCTKDIVLGIHGTDVHAGAIKLASSQPQMTAAEEKAFRAGARTQKATGVFITTHCTATGAISSQLKVLDEEGVDLRRVAIGHVGWAMREPEGLKIVMEWMKRGANFLSTNMGIEDEKTVEYWRPLVEAIHEVFERGHGDKLVFGLDCGFSNSDAPFHYKNVPPPPFLHMFTHTLPAFRKLGLTAAEEETIMRKNPQRILPVQ